MQKQLLLNLISEVKARLQGKVDGVTFPIPQFIVVGKQSVGKSRLIESLAGEPFNFVSGTLGSRRPTVLEFRNVPGLHPSRWSVFDEERKMWNSYPVSDVMQMVGRAHEELGKSVSEAPIRVKVEGADTVDLGLVDLPGFRAYAADPSMQDLANKIELLVWKFMKDENNVMLCVEEAGDAAGFATLGKCKQVDPTYRRTILVRNKLDKYYNDLDAEHINKWLEGYGDLPPDLRRFAISLPHWTGDVAPLPFHQMREQCAETDLRTLESKGMSGKYTSTIGIENFRLFMEDKTQQLFAEALSPMLTRLTGLQADFSDRVKLIQQEREITNEDNILHATRQAGICFAQSFNFLMEGALSAKEENLKSMDDELKAFHEHIKKNNIMKESEALATQFPDVESYITYLRETVKLPGMDTKLNGGAQFKRLMYEVEVFTRFAGLEQKFQRKDVIQARGTGLSEVTWHSVIVELMRHNAPTKMTEKTKYVGERIKWFFMEQKDYVLEFMLAIKNSPEEHLYSSRLYNQAKVIERNDAMKRCIYNTFDATCRRHREAFMQMWTDWMYSMFTSPLKLVKANSMPRIDPSYETEIAPTFASTKKRIQEERTKRDSVQAQINEEINHIPTDDRSAEDALPMIQKIIEKTFSRIRCAVSDQMELYSKSFFLLPMLRRLEGDMARLELGEQDKMQYRARSEALLSEEKKNSSVLTDLNWCVDAIQKFRITCNDSSR